MKKSRKYHDLVVVKEITDGMCGRCAHWFRVGDDLDGECAVLAISHMRGGLVKRRWKPFLYDPKKPLESAVKRRTWDADDGWYWDEAQSGEVVGAENFMDVPEIMVNSFGDRKRVWSPLRSFGWFGCSRYEGKRFVEDDGKSESIPVVTGSQLSLLEDGEW